MFLKYIYMSVTKISGQSRTFRDKACLVSTFQLPKNITKKISTSYFGYTLFISGHNYDTNINFYFKKLAQQV